MSQSSQNVEKLENLMVFPDVSTNSEKAKAGKTAGILA